MLLFIQWNIGNIGMDEYFNTTLVIVYQSLLSLRPILRRNFNTTLVIVYLNSVREIIHCDLFQYNSCYCLSKRPPESRLHWKRFQYNSCYCLSISTGQGVSSFFNFNTTLVIVYRFRSTEEPLQGSYFNTTLVIVYPTLLSHFCFLL